MKSMTNKNKKLKNQFKAKVGEEYTLKILSKINNENQVSYVLIYIYYQVLKLEVFNNKVLTIL